MATELRSKDIGIPPNLLAFKILSPPHPHDVIHVQGQFSPDLPDEASKDEDLSASYSSSSSEREGVRKDNKRKKMVSFADYSNEPQGIIEGEDSDDDKPEAPSPFLALRGKRSASLPHIELNPKLNKKIKKMFEEAEEEDSLNTLLEGNLTLLGDDKDKSTSELRYEYEFNGGQLLQVRVGDIREECVDVIVSEANSNLQHNSGIAGAISQAGGRDIQLQSDRWVRKYGPVPPGRVAITEAGSLAAKRVIHAVGPIWRGGNSNEDHEYWDAIWHSLETANKHKFKSISIPAIGYGFLGFPKDRCAYLLVDCVSKFWLKYPKSKLREVRFVNFDVDVSEALVFEMVGKFTAGCETSESERDYSGSEMDDISGSDLEEEEEEDISNVEQQTPEQKNMMAHSLALKKYISMNAQARRQSIA